MRIVLKKQIGGGVYPFYYYNNLVEVGAKARKNKEAKDEETEEDDEAANEEARRKADAAFPRSQEPVSITTLNGIKRVHYVGSGEGYTNGTEYESLTNLKTGETAEATITIDPKTGQRTWTFEPGLEEIYNKLGNIYYGR